YNSLGVATQLPSDNIPGNQDLLQVSPPVFRCPSDPAPMYHDTSLSALAGAGIEPASGAPNVDLAVTNYIGSNNSKNVRRIKSIDGRDGSTGAAGVFWENSDCRIRAIPDGTSNTLLAG